MAAVTRTPTSGEPSASTEGSHTRLTPATRDSFKPRTPVGTEGIAGLLTGWVAVPRGSSLDGGTSDPAGMATVIRAAEQRAERFGTGAESVAPLVEYFRNNGGKFPELTDLATGGSGNYSAAASRPGLPGASAVAPWWQNTNILIALGAAGLAVWLLMRPRRK